MGGNDAELRKVVDDTPLSKLLWQRKGKELAKKVGLLNSMAKAHAGKVLNVVFVDANNREIRKPMIVSTTDSVIKLTVSVAKMFGWNDSELVDLDVNNGEDNGTGELSVIDEDHELERLLAARLSWESGCKEDVLEAGLETIRSLLLSERPEVRNKGPWLRRHK